MNRGTIERKYIEERVNILRALMKKYGKQILEEDYAQNKIFNPQIKFHRPKKINVGE